MPASPASPGSPGISASAERTTPHAQRVLLWALMAAALAYAVAKRRPWVAFDETSAVALGAGLGVLAIALVIHVARRLARALGGGLGAALAWLRQAAAWVLAEGLAALAGAIDDRPAAAARANGAVGSDRASVGPAASVRLAAWLRGLAGRLREDGHAGFEDRYRIVRALPTGGSTARVFLVEPREAPAEGPAPRYVVKLFDLGQGSRLEELVRESRALEGARRIGAIVEHHLDARRFWYAMPYHEGPTLAELADPGPLAVRLRRMRSLLGRLGELHAAGLIHKDVKPQNLIVQGDDLIPIDLGLLTDVRSALTLTTHGTEYFRDPGMVELAMAGTRVRDVDARRFDVYSAGAVLYLLLEGRFPACGPLSRFSKPVAPALEWVARRAMAEGSERYAGVLPMRADIEVCLAALEGGRLERLRPADLPSFREAGDAADAIGLAPAPAGVTPRRGRWRGVARALAAACVLAIAVLAGHGLGVRKGVKLGRAIGKSDEVALLDARAADLAADLDGRLPSMDPERASAAALARAIAAWRAGPLAEALAHRAAGGVSVSGAGASDAAVRVASPESLPVVAIEVVEGGPGGPRMAARIALELCALGVPALALVDRGEAALERPDQAPWEREFLAVRVRPGEPLDVAYRGIAERLRVSLPLPARAAVESAAR